jgi:predicted small lipoprotein YifL
MKRYLSAAVVAATLLALTACGGGPVAGTAAPASSETATATPSDTPSPTHSPRAVPDVTGKKFLDARKILIASGFYGDAWGKDGKEWKNATPDASLQVVSTTPAAGTVTTTEDIRINLAVKEADNAGLAQAAAAAAKANAAAAATAAQAATRYAFRCGPTTSADGDTYHTLKEVWASVHYKASDTCMVTYDGHYAREKPAALPDEQKIVDIVAASGGDASGAPIETYDSVLRLCTKLDSIWADSVWANPEWKKAEAKAALALCPDAPHDAVFRSVITTSKVAEGTHVVGKGMDPGTYQTVPGVKDCYWARTTGGGRHYRQ